MRDLPAIVSKLVMHHSAWIVGSAALAANEHPRDIDVLVPFANWAAAASLIPSDARSNTFGGWKFVDEGCMVDVWPGDLGWILACSKATVVWHPYSGVRWTRG